MGDEEHADRVLVPDLKQLELHELSSLGIQGAEGLVHQQDLRFGRERASQSSALLHASGELVRVTVLEALERRKSDVLLRRPSRLTPLRPANAQAVGDIVEHGLPWEEPEVLEDDRDAGNRCAHVDIAVEDNLPVVRRHKAVEAAEQRGLPAARGAYH